MNLTQIAEEGFTKAMLTTENDELHNTTLQKLRRDNFYSKKSPLCTKMKENRNSALVQKKS